MAIEALGGVVSNGNAASAESLSVSQLDFIRILVTQLSSQDPLHPTDPKDFVTQLAQFTTLEQTQQVTDGINNLLSIQASTQSVGLIGKTVDVTTASGTQTGTVTTITFSNGQPTLSLQLTTGAVVTGISPATVTLVR
jgi:flagellar basal-body rod modification protein FlgD